MELSRLATVWVVRKTEYERRACVEDGEGCRPSQTWQPINRLLGAAFHRVLQSSLNQKTDSEGEGGTLNGHRGVCTDNQPGLEDHGLRCGQKPREPGWKETAQTPRGPLHSHLCPHFKEFSSGGI